MGTFEIIIVFSALMALIALVTVGIDWIGKPLKHRRFIPRIYRFDDEKLPTDAYGHTTLETGSPATMASPPLPYMQPPPVVVAHMPTIAPDPRPAAAETNLTVPARAVQPPPRKVASVDPSVLTGAAAAAFSNTLAAPEMQPVAATEEDWIGTQTTVTHTPEPSPSATGWVPGMTLDATIQDRKPNLATKAERFWKNSAQSLHDSHFDGDDLERMRSGKAPRRTNPRTGRVESMQLTGLRQASTISDVRMRWPDDSVDPWNA